MERAETQEDIALKINGDAVRNLAEAAREFGVTLIHISTDYVFDGQTNVPVSEDAAAGPCGAYGRTKLVGERYIAESGCNALIIRTAWLYSEYGRNFVKTMFNLTNERDHLKVVVDQIGSPTYARDLADAIVRILESRVYKGREGVYHYSNTGVCSWFDLAAMTARLSGHSDCNMAPFGIAIPYWVDSLAECVKRLKKAKNDSL